MPIHGHAWILSCLSWSQLVLLPCYWLSSKWTLTVIQAQYIPVEAFELFRNESQERLQVPISVLLTLHRGMGSSVRTSCSWHLTSSRSLVCVSEISHSPGKYQGLSNEWPLWGPPCFEANGPASISPTNGSSAWLLTPKLSILLSQSHDLTSTCLSTSVFWAEENSSPDQQPTKNISRHSVHPAKASQMVLLESGKQPP